MPLQPALAPALAAICEAREGGLRADELPSLDVLERQALVSLLWHLGILRGCARQRT